MGVEKTLFLHYPQAAVKRKNSALLQQSCDGIRGSLAPFLLFQELKAVFQIAAQASELLCRRAHEGRVRSWGFS